MNKKTVIVFFSLGVLILPGLCAALEFPKFIVTNATHSSYVQLTGPSTDDAQNCAQHLGELLEEGLEIDDTNTLKPSPQRILGEFEDQYSASFHLSNGSFRNTKTAIIKCAITI